MTLTALPDPVLDPTPAAPAAPVLLAAPAGLRLVRRDDESGRLLAARPVLAVRVAGSGDGDGHVVSVLDGYGQWHELSTGAEWTVEPSGADE